MTTICCFGFLEPKNQVSTVAIISIIIAFFSASQDIVIDAFRIESAPQRLQGPLSSMYIAGYRFAMLVSGAGSLWLAAFLGNEIYDKAVWQVVYITMAFLMLIGILTTFFSDG